MAKSKSVAVKGGLRCPQCGQDMQRFEHARGWSPKQGQPFWFGWWDICRRCNRTQHYEAAKQYPILKGVEAGKGPWSAQGRPAGEGWQQAMKRKGKPLWKRPGWQPSPVLKGRIRPGTSPPAL